MKIPIPAEIAKKLAKNLSADELETLVELIIEYGEQQYSKGLDDACRD